MAAYELKTKKNAGDVYEFIDGIAGEQKRRDSLDIIKLMQEATGQPPVMWGKSIVGFGSYHYKGKTSEGEWMAMGFSPRKQSLSLYVFCDFNGGEELLESLGKHKKSVGCLYINKLSDVDMAVLKKLIKKSYSYVKTEIDQRR
jgi:hypothetical protein